MTNPPDRQTVNDMMDFINVVSEEPQELPARPVNAGQPQTSITPMDIQGDIERANKDATRNLLESLGDLLDEPESEQHTNVQQSFQNAAVSAYEDIKDDVGLREATQTTRTPTGFIYGEWELIERKKNEKKTFYTIRHTGTSEILAKDLRLREAALSLVKMLNEGRPINSPSCFEALQLDMKYQSCIFEMANLNTKKGAIYEDKYDSARDKAVSAKKRAQRILNDLRGLK